MSELENRLVEHLARLAEIGARGEPCKHEGYVPARFVMILDRHISELHELFPEEGLGGNVLLTQFVVNAFRDLITGTNLSSPVEGETRWGDQQLEKWRRQYWRSRGVRECAVCGARHHPADSFAAMLKSEAADELPRWFCPHHGSAATALHELGILLPEIVERLARTHTPSEP